MPKRARQERPEPLSLTIPARPAELLRKRSRALGKPPRAVLVEILEGRRGGRLLFDPGEVRLSLKARDAILASGRTVEDLVDRFSSGDSGEVEDDEATNMRLALRGIECPIFAAFSCGRTRVLLTAYLADRLTWIETSREFVRREDDRKEPRFVVWRAGAKKTKSTF